MTLITRKVLDFKVDKLAMTVQVLHLFSTVGTSLFHSKVDSLQVVPQVRLVLKSLLTLRAHVIALLFMDNPHVAGKTGHPHHLLALRASHFGLLVNTFHVLL